MVQSMTTAVLSALEQRLEQPTAKGLAHAVSAAIRDGDAGRRATGCRRSARWRPSSPCRPRPSAPPGRCSRGRARVAHRRPAGHDGARPGGARRAAATARRSTHRRASPLDLSTGVPDPRLLPDLGAVAARSSPGARHRAATSTSPVLPGPGGRAARRLAVRRASTSPSSTARWTRMDLVVRTPPAVRRPGRGRGPRLPAAARPARVGRRAAGRRAARRRGPRRSTPLAEALARARGRRLPPAPRPEPDRRHHDAGAGARRSPSLLAAATRSSSRTTRPAGCPSTAAREPGRAGCPTAPCTSAAFSKSHGPDLRLAALSGAAGAAPGRHGPPASSGRAGPAGCCSRCCSTCSPRRRREPRWRRARRRMPRGGPTSSTPWPRGASRSAGTEGINIWVPVHDETAAVVRLASQGIGVAAGRTVPAAARPATAATSGSPSALRATTSDALADALAGGGRGPRPGRCALRLAREPA